MLPPPPARSRVTRVIVFSLVMLALAVASNAVMDTLAYRYQQSIFKPLGCPGWFDPAVSWRNKWKNGDPAQGNAFPLASTALVAATDAWHLAKFLCITFLLLAFLAPFRFLIHFPWPVWAGIFLALKILWGVLFESLFAGLFIVR